MQTIWLLMHCHCCYCYRILFGIICQVLRSMFHSKNEKKIQKICVICVWLLSWANNQQNSSCPNQLHMSLCFYLNFSRKFQSLKLANATVITQLAANKIKQCHTNVVSSLNEWNLCRQSPKFINKKFQYQLG